MWRVARLLLVRYYGVNAVQLGSFNSAVTRIARERHWYSITLLWRFRLSAAVVAGGGHTRSAAVMCVPGTCRDRLPVAFLCFSVVIIVVSMSRLRVMYVQTAHGTYSAALCSLRSWLRPIQAQRSVHCAACPPLQTSVNIRRAAHVAALPVAAHAASGGAVRGVTSAESCGTSGSDAVFTRYSQG